MVASIQAALTKGQAARLAADEAATRAWLLRLDHVTAAIHKTRQVLNPRSSTMV